MVTPPSRAHRVFCVGETMAVVTTADGTSIVASDSFMIDIGGAESNVAAHLAGLGHDVAWLSRLGSDPLGERIMVALARSGVDTSRVARDNSAHTGVYFKETAVGRPSEVLYYRADSAASRMSVDDLDSWPLASGDWVHLSGITPALSESCNTLVETILLRAKTVGYTVSFDVNHRRGLWSAADAAGRLLELALLSDVVLVGLDEAQSLWGVDSAEDVSALLVAPSYVVVKDGAVEAVEFARSTSGHVEVNRVPARAVDVVEPVGAGDAFAAGYLDALFSGGDAATRLLRGHEFAAWTLGSLHDFRPYPSNGVTIHD